MQGFVFQKNYGLKFLSAESFVQSLHWQCILLLSGGVSLFLHQRLQRVHQLGGTQCGNAQCVFSLCLLKLHCSLPILRFKIFLMSIVMMKNRLHLNNSLCLNERKAFFLFNSHLVNILNMCILLRLPGCDETISSTLIIYVYWPCERVS